MNVKTGIFIGLVLLLCFVMPASAVPITNGLVAEYDFQEGVDSAILYDISGNGHDGAIYSDVVWTDYGIMMNGVNNSIDVGDLGNLSDGFTFVAATRNDNIGVGRQVLFSRINSTSGTNPDGKGFLIEKMSLNHEWQTAMYHGASSDIASARVVGDSYGWQIISSRYNATALSFVTTTGVRCSNIEYGQTIASGELREHEGKYVIGRPSYTGNHYYDGDIGYIVVYNRTLSDSEFKEVQLYIQSVMENRGIEMPKSISTPYIVMTLDDGRDTDFNNATRIAYAKNIPLTSYIISDYVGNDRYLSWSQIRELRNFGNGIECHTNSHINLIDTNDEEIANSLIAVNTAFLLNGLATPEHIAYPFGADDERSRAVVAQYRESGRDITAVNAKNIISDKSLDSKYQFNAYNIYKFPGDNVTDIKELVDDAIANDTCLIFYTHDVSDDPESCGCTNEAFEEVINYIALKRDAGLVIPVTHDGLYRAMHGIRTVGYSGNTLTGQTTEVTEDKTVDQVGFVWGTTRKNNPGNVAPSATAYSHYWTSNGDYKDTEFTHAVSFSGTVYYRAAAKVNGTWVYGEELTVDSTLKMPYVSNGISYRVDANGYVYNYSKKLTTETKAPLVVIPSDDTVNVTVDAWSINNKVWKESSESHDITTTHIIGGLPAGYDINILCDGALYRTERVNSTGYITWTYSGGFSEHTFEAVISGYPVTADIQDSFVSSWGNTVSMVGAIIVIALAGSMIMMFRGKKDLSEVMNDLPGIILIVVLLVTGAIIFGQF